MTHCRTYQDFENEAHGCTPSADMEVLFSKPGKGLSRLAAIVSGQSAVHETDVNGCHVTVENMNKLYHNEPLYRVTVGYSSYNSNGVHVASPVWVKECGATAAKEFIKDTVEYASDHNRK